MRPPESDMADHDLLVRVDERTTTTAASVAGLERRVSSLERWAWSLPVTALGTLLTAAGALWTAAQR